jgi:hypothetical protein
MNRKSLTLAAVAVAAFQMSVAAPARAEESEVKKAVMFPVRSAAAVLAVMVGTPIAISRLSVQRYHRYLEDAADLDPQGGPSASIVYALPIGFGEGFAHGLYYGPRNAIANFDKPLSKDSLSLGEHVAKTP